MEFHEALPIALALVSVFVILKPRAGHSLFFKLFPRKKFKKEEELVIRYDITDFLKRQCRLTPDTDVDLYEEMFHHLYDAYLHYYLNTEMHLAAPHHGYPSINRVGFLIIKPVIESKFDLFTANTVNLDLDLGQPYSSRYMFKLEADKHQPDFEKRFDEFIPPELQREFAAHLLLMSIHND